ncbi:outer membrane protein assembly factor BamA [Desulfobacter hydrogenophilus]|uniref:Outer membrane protein assembly factor BamA n=1 Tax=Desulfobacter hydrogenophilus TaxID=2291 RepID=A0A328FG97_9BACT|nr:outer membrane protein assembly factor BamA [Desulfobacter hydrogenophilus]NDY70590.1 outer membrane protein assembly factor BamA [Desulfobacter hydrogenophilus]QBH13959.1 outer membrane protein assembly factor BamA [Desulfobacter hydrogenophilus]RAM03628.1 outer membrane protein assembly factor BamA [Desulfobacter hydrogenophilus]
MRFINFRPFIISVVFAACVLLGVAVPVSAADAVKVTDINILVNCPPEKQAFWHSIASSFIPVNVGDDYSIEVMASAIKALTQAQLFEFINVPDPEKTEHGMVLAFELTPFSRIKDIHIKNAFPVFEQEVLNAMTIKTGEVYQAQKMADEVQRVETLFKRHGFYAPKVNLSAVKQGDCYVIDVDIDKGPFHNIRKVEFKGNDDIGQVRLQLMTGVWRKSLLPWHGNRFTDKQMTDDIKKVIQLYRKNGYADVQVTAKTLPVKGSDALDVIFTIDEGPLYKIDIQGNEAFYNWSLKKEFLLKESGNKNDFALKKSIRNIRTRYEAKGFRDAKVKDEKDDSQRLGVRQVNIVIDEGLKHRVSELKISGADTLPFKELQKNILTRKKGVFSQTELRDDLKAVKALYFSKGFTKTKVNKKVKISDTPDKNEKQVAVEIIIKEGPRTKVEQVEIQGLSVIALDEVRDAMVMKAGRWYDRALIEADISALQQKVSEKGYPHAQVTADSEFSKDRTRIRITYHVDQGPKVVVGKIFYAGALRMKQEELEDEMAVAPGDPFSMLKIVDSRRNIQDLNAVDTVRIRVAGLKNRQSEADLIVEISEKKPYYVELAVGYDTSRHLYMETGIGDKNFLGHNLNAQAGLELSQVGYGMEVFLTEPRFLSTRFTSTSKVYTKENEAFNKDYGIRTYGLSQTFLRNFSNKKINLFLGGGYEYRDQYLRVDRELDDDEKDDYGFRNIGQINTGISWRTTDSLVHPRKGLFASTTFDVFKGIDSSLNDFYKYGLELRYYLPVTDDLVIAMRGRYGYMDTYGGNTNISDGQLYYLGGASTVRGFDENMLQYDDDDNAVGGRSMMLGSVEARYGLSLNYEFALFFDTGALTETQDSVISESFRSSVGIGLRRQTPVGPISVLYGWKLDPQAGESKGCFYFSMGYTF